MNLLNERQMSEIGLKYILENIEVLSPFGKTLLKNIKIYKKNDKKQLIIEFNNIEKIIKTLDKNKMEYQRLRNIFRKIRNIKTSLDRIKKGNVLDDVELYEIKFFSLLVSEVIDIYSNMDIDIKGIVFFKNKEVIRLLDPEGTRIPTFYIYEAYSEELKNIRIEKRKLEKQILIEENKEKSNQFKMERKNIVVKEKEIELGIRKELSHKLKEHIKVIDNNINSIAKFDLLIAKAKLAVDRKGIKPILKDSSKIKIIDARNPMIEDVLSKRDKIFIPITIEIKEGVSVITGANMGGKSVSLKTITLNIILSLMGIYPFAEEIHMPLLDFIGLISEDMQSISKGLSTFGAEIVKLKDIISIAKESRGLILLDELAKGTNPEEGFHIVKALMRYLSSLTSFTVITTHYDGVIEPNITHYQVIGLKNVNFNNLKNIINTSNQQSIENIQEYMDYRLEKVRFNSEVPKDALNICVLLGLEKEIVDIAKNNYNKGGENDK